MQSNGTLTPGSTSAVANRKPPTSIEETIQFFLGALAPLRELFPPYLDNNDPTYVSSSFAHT